MSQRWRGGKKRDGGRRGEQPRRRDVGRSDIVRRSSPRGSSYSRRPTKSAPRRLPPELLTRLESDPLFQVVTLDKQTWIDPFTGESVTATEGLEDAIRQHLLNGNVHPQQDTLPMQQVLAIRWRHDLLRILPHEPRLRIFGKDGEGWFNPYSGAFIPHVSREDRRITMRTVVAMAESLARCPYARNGVMLDKETLQERIRALGHQPGTGESSRAGESGSFAFSEDLQRARNVQEHMLSDLPHLPGYQVGLHYQPHSGVSGDFYEIMPLPNGRFLLVVGDVSGHGMQAALVVATALKTLRILARNANDLVSLLGGLNDEIAGDLLPGQFLTVFAAVFDHASNTLTCVLAGHHPLLAINPDKTVMVRKVGRPGMAIGLVNGRVFRESLKAEVVPIDPGDVLVQYTDGVVEAIDAEAEEFGLHRLTGLLLQHGQMPVQELVDKVAEEVTAFSGGSVDDDLTMLALGRLPEDDDDY